MDEKLEKLLAQLPKRFGVSQKIVDRLNKNGTMTKYNRKYTIQNVRNILNGIHQDDNVVLELVSLVKEYKTNKLSISKKIESALV